LPNALDARRRAPWRPARQHYVVGGKLTVISEETIFVVPSGRLKSNIYSRKWCVVGLVVGPRVIDAGLSQLLVLIAPVSVAAGFPSPAQDYFDGRIDLNAYLIKDVTSTFIVRVAGHSMEQAGISDGDELIVNRALEPKDGSVVIAVLDGELTIKRLRITPNGVVLQAENPLFPDIRVPALSELTIWGVATRCLHHI
jgi:DNA polymerase V